MIASIKAVGSCGSIIDYNEDKVQEQEAERFYSNMMYEEQTAREDFQEELEATADMNEKLSTNKYYHIPISFRPGEDPSPEKTKSILDTYMKEMGMEHRPFVAYRHNDTANVHYHLVIPTVDNFGTKTKEWKNHELNEKVTRAIEKQFGLIETDYSNALFLDSQNVSNLRDKRLYYSLSSLNKKALTSLEAEFHFDFKDFKNKSNTEIRDLIGPDTYSKLYTSLQENNLLRFSLKEEIRYQLINIRNKTHSLEDFKQMVEQEGLYIRKLTEKGSTDFKYGKRGEDGKIHYFYGYKLSKNLSFQSLSKGRSTKEEKYDLKKEKTIKSRMASIIFRTMRSSKDIHEFKASCLQKGIKVISKGSTKSFSGFRFEALNNSDLNFKGSDLHRKLSSNQIIRRIAINGIAPDELTKQAAQDISKSNKLPTKTPSQSPNETENQEERNRKRRKKKEEKEQDRGI